MVIFSDVNVLSMIVCNLFDNVIKFMLEGGWIIFEGIFDEGLFWFKVWDIGVGMLFEQLKEFFLFKKGCIQFGIVGEKGLGLGFYLAYEFLKFN